MSQEVASIVYAVGPTRKCVECQLRNFQGTKRCRRCKADLSLPLKVISIAKSTRVISAESGRPAFSITWILGAASVVILGALFLYMRQAPPASLAELNKASVAQPAVVDAEQAAQNLAEANSRSQAIATQALAELKRFQAETESGMPYTAYDLKLTHLKSELDSALPSFVHHGPADEMFRQEIAAALRDYTAAGNWWKTTEANSSVFSETDRTERTQVNWASARAHLTTAEKMLVH